MKYYFKCARPTSSFHAALDRAADPPAPAPADRQALADRQAHAGRARPVFLCAPVLRVLPVHRVEHQVPQG